MQPFSDVDIPVIYGSSSQSGLWLLGTRSPNLEVLQLAREQHLFSIFFSLSASGILQINQDVTCALEANTVVVVTPQAQQLEWYPKTPEQPGLWLMVDRDYFQQAFSARPESLRPSFAQLLESTPSSSEFFHRETLSLNDRALISTLLKPTISNSASPLWYQAKSTELLLKFVCRQEGDTDSNVLFCSYLKRQAQDRVAKCKKIIAARLDEPIELNLLAREVACSPAYLSRSFSSEAGMTLRQFQRAARIERAAQLLSSGRFNVSEAAVEVGYQSLSQFGRAFREERGLTPRDFLKAL